MTELLAQSMFAEAVEHYKGGDSPRAKDLLEAVMRSGYNETWLKGAYVMGCIERESGNAAEAMRWFVRFLDDLAQYPTLTGYRIYGHYSLGRTYRDLSQYTDAIREYNLALELGGDKETRCKVLHNLAWVYCLCDDSHSAAAHLAQSKGLATTSELQAHQGLGEAFVAVVRGQHRTARERLLALPQDGDIGGQVAWLQRRIVAGVRA